MVVERSKKIFNLSARLELKCGGEEFQGEEHSAVRSNGAVSPVIKQLQKQNDKKRSKQEQLERATWVRFVVGDHNAGCTENREI